MLLKDVLTNVSIVAQGGNPNVKLTGVQLDSRRVQPGDIFVARRGVQVDGHRYIGAAVDRGAAAIVTEQPLTEVVRNRDVSWVQVQDSESALARIAANYNGSPSSGMHVVGITGTNGKTTSAFFTEAVLQSGGHATGILGTVIQRWPGVEERAEMTTPDAVQLQETLARMRRAETTAAVLEVSSHAIEQRRVEALNFSVAAFTNLSQDHLDYHGTMESYGATKTRLFTELLPASEGAKGAVVNVDDPVGRTIIDACPMPTLRYGVMSPANTDLFAEDVVSDVNGTRARLVGDWGEATIHTSLVGEHNLLNAMAAVGSGLLLDLTLEEAVRGISSVASIPGRLSPVGQSDIRVFVDYAHTPDALSAVLAALAKVAKGRIITVFGCGGDRDRTKRGAMGVAASQGSDVVVLTSDNPRKEPPMQIIEDVLNGMKPVSRYDGERGLLVEEDRKQAIDRAVGLARPGDLVLIAGKGHEVVQEVAEQKLRFSDTEVAQQALAARGGAQQ